MRMTKSQLKQSVKAIVRECLNERVIKEVAPPGDKAERMVQHVKTSLKKSHPDWDAEKIASVAIATAWKAHNKGSVEQDECGSMEEGGVQGADSKVTVIDDIVRGIIKLAPAIKNNPDKIAKVAALFFHRQYGEVADMDAVMQAVERNMGYGDSEASDLADEPADKPVAKGVDKEEEEESSSEEQDECGGSCEEEEEEGKSEEQEESHEEEEESVNEAQKDYKSCMGCGRLVKKGEKCLKCQETDKEQKRKDVNEAKGKGKAKTLPPNKAQYKVATARQYTTTDQNKALTIQTDPEVNENANTLPPNKGQYKTVAPHQYTTTAQNKPLTIQTDPKVNEAGLTSEMPKKKSPKQPFAGKEIPEPQIGGGMEEPEPFPATPEPEMGMGEPEMGMPPMGGEMGGEPEGHDYDEHEEITLIKVIGRAAEKLEAMHDGMEGGEPEIPLKKTFPSKPLDGGEPKKPAAGGEKKPSPEKKDSKPAPKGKDSPGDKKDKKKDKDVDENHRVQARSYVTVKDNPNDPNVMRDPENPQSNGA